MRVLMLGATGFIGPHFIKAALNGGHDVTVFDRGKTGAPPHDIEHLIGDRESDLRALRGRHWDAVLDLATFGPKWVKSLGETFGSRIGHYTFVSTVNVYDQTHASAHTDETSDLVHDAATQRTYGGQKVLAEREAARHFSDRLLIVRPSYIVGPGDRVGILNYWAARAALGGEVLAGGDPKTRVHVIDVRDLARWTMDMVARREGGAFNTVGPSPPLTWGSLLALLSEQFERPFQCTWVPLSWLAVRGLTDDMHPLRFWGANVCAAGATFLSNEKARDKGLKVRPLADTIADGRAAAIAVGRAHGVTEQQLAFEKSLLDAWRSSQATTLTHR